MALVSALVVWFLASWACSHWIPKFLGLPQFHPASRAVEQIVTIGVTIWAFVSALHRLHAKALACMERERRKGRADLNCVCGYNLTGNVSGICPECGTPVPPGAAPPVRPADAPEEGNAQ